MDRRGADAAAAAEAVALQGEPAETGWALYGALALCDPELAVHSGRSALVALVLSAAVGVEVGSSAFWGYLLHDVGTLEIPSELLDQPGPLSPEDREQVSTHAVRSALVLARSPELDVAVSTALHHHERWDGSGYPFGLREDEIPVTSRVLAVADAYAALTEPRPYRPARDWQEAVDTIVQYQGTQFDPSLAEAFVHVAPELPPALRRPWPDAAVHRRTDDRLAEHARRARDLSRAQLEALYASALGLDAVEAASRLGRAPGTQRTWSASLRRTLACPARVPLRRFLSAVGRDLFAGVAPGQHVLTA